MFHTSARFIRVLSKCFHWIRWFSDKYNFLIKRFNLVYKRSRWYYSASKTQVTGKIFKSTPIHASVIYQIPWIQWISLQFGEHSIMLHWGKRCWAQMLGPVYTKHQRQCCDNSAMTRQNGFATHFQASPLISMRTESLVSSQSGRIVDADAWCKRALMGPFTPAILSTIAWTTEI